MAETRVRELKGGIRASCVVLLCGLVSATVFARPGYANLINSYCRDKGAPRVRYTDDGCALCHHGGTFTADARHRAEPVWTEFELGRSSGDYSFFCPGPLDSGPAITSTDLAAEPPNELPAPSPDGALSHADMPWMALGYPTGHLTVENLDAPGQAKSRTPEPAAGNASGPPVTKDANAANTALSISDKTKRQLDKLRGDLAITPAQQPIWTELQDAVLAASVGTEGRSPQAAAPPPLSDRLAAQQRHHALRIARLRAVNTAVVRLNAQLNERQQRLLAARLPPMIGEP